MNRTLAGGNPPTGLDRPCAKPVLMIHFLGDTMGLSIASSPAAQTFALSNEASSRVLYNGHAGLGADLVDQPADAAIDGRSSDGCKNLSQGCPPKADDEVLLAFDQSEARRPLVLGPLWDSKAEPPRDDFAPEVKRPDLRALRAASHLDSMSEMGEMESLRLQMAMDRLSKMMSTLSNVLQKIEDTQAAITQDLK